MIVDEMKERPILFNTEMVKAILDGRKTMTRRVLKPQPYMERGVIRWQPRKGYDLNIEHLNQSLINKLCPYGQVGQRLWVRETWNVYDIGYDNYNGGWEVGYPLSYIPKEKPRQCCLSYYATDDDPTVSNWRPSTHMPRWASRITLEITEVRVERVQEITEEDANAEGNPFPRMGGKGSLPPIWWFKELWDSLNAKRGYGWEVNPWVWVLDFRKVE